MVYTAIKKLVQYGLETGLITETDRIYATNQILEALKLEEYEEPQDTVGTGNLETDTPVSLKILDPLSGGRSGGCYQLFLQTEPGFRLHSQIPGMQGSEVGDQYTLRRSGYHHQFI